VTATAAMLKKAVSFFYYAPAAFFYKQKLSFLEKNIAA
jgi:hypothetical protein